MKAFKSTGRIDVVANVVRSEEFLHLEIYKVHLH